MRSESTDIIVSPRWLNEQLDTVTVVDVRDQRDYHEMGHIPGAVNIPFDRLRDPGDVAEGMLPDPDDFARLLGNAGLSSEDTIVAYDDDRGVYAARFLLTAFVYGHQGDLHLLDGDYSVWQQSYNTTNDEPDPTSTMYEVNRPDDLPIVDRSEVETAIESDTLLVDTRTPAEYEEAHIPGAVQLSWEDLVDKDTRRLKSRDDIEAILADREITPERRIVLYCNTARRLSHTYVVLRQLGYEDVRFYEGSLTDWVRAEAPEWDPVGLQNRVRTYAPEGLDRVVEELGEDVFNRLKLIGLYHQKQDGYFMLRTKVPGGVLTAEKANVIGTVADEFARAPDEHGGPEQNPVFGDGFLDVTTRQDIQMHWIEIEDIPEIWDRYEAVGLTTLQACGNSVRNVVSCPAAGIDSSETIDVRSISEKITEHFLGDRTYANLPRKLKVSVTGCHENCARAHINDLGFTPAVKDGRDGFHVRIGGGLSDGPRMATDLDIFVEPQEVVELVEATADFFIEYGSYLDTAVNRLRFLVEELGVDAVRDELDQRVSFEFESSGESLTTDYRGDHVGIHEQDDGRYYVGLNVPTGRMLGSEFAELATLAREFGDGEVRLTLNQNVLLPSIPGTHVSALRGESLLERYSPDPGPFTRGVVTCTGSEFCSYGIIETKSRAIRWARRLDDWADGQWDDPPDAIRLHLSGCSASCAQPQIADIGLRGETYRDETAGEREAVDVGLGGDLGRETFIDWVAGEVPIETIPDAVKRLTTTYVNERETSEETPAEWLNNMPTDTLQELVVPTQEAH
jgi:ferredoxin-nitrite reductase